MRPIAPGGPNYHELCHHCQCQGSALLRPRKNVGLMCDLLFQLQLRVGRISQVVPCTRLSFGGWRSYRHTEWSTALCLV